MLKGSGSIYLVRLGLATYYGYRTSSVQAHIDDLTRQRDGTIEKLKAATKFNSTQELLKKYGGSPTPKPKPTGTPDRKTTPKQGMQKEARTSFVPPPTANIPGRDRPLNDSSPLMSPTPAGQSSRQQVPMSPLRVPQSAEAPGSPVDVSAEFAPNAYSAPPQYAQMNEGSRWYDKILDVLLGEDETRPGARIALICHQCRLVNGQAPPGVKHLEDLGKWRCCGCGALNGEESEVTKIVSSIKEASQETPRIDEGDQRRKVPKSNSREQGNAQIPALDGHDSDVTEDSTQNSEDSDALPRKEMMEVTKSRESPAAETDATRRRSTRSTKGKKAG